MTKLLLTMLLFAGAAFSQGTFSITGTAIPNGLLKLNYGTLPSGVRAYDLNICNLTDSRRPITSSEIFQALAESDHDLRPIGRQIMLAAILHNQNHSLKTWLNLALTSSAGVLSILGANRTGSPALLSSWTLGALIGQQLLATWNPVLTANQVEKFESQVLEPALVMDSGSCLERTVFTADTTARSHKGTAAPEAVNFSVRVP